MDVSRWQFGITTIYHYIFVPLTMGLAPVVAGMQTAWLRTGKEHWYRATRFFGALFLINFAMGVVTGIVQEFQFGMNWSEYSRFVGDVFGAPLALEGLAAFFFESIFLGAWIFGWGRMPGWLHNLCIWMVAIAVNVSAYFIIVANSFMQHPVGAIYNEETGRAELVDFWALLTNPTALAAVPHAFFAALLVSGTLITGIAGFWMVRNKRHGTALPGSYEGDADNLWRSSMRVGAWVLLIAIVGVSLTGHTQAQLMFEQQPMKMASAEALCQTETDPRFSILSISFSNDCDDTHQLIGLPWVLSFLAGNRFTGVTLQGVEELQAQYTELYGAGDYAPNMFVTYWAFRLMIGFMIPAMVMMLLSFWYSRKGKTTSATWFKWASLASLPFPFLANWAGWVFTEMGRQPWIVHPNPDYQGLNLPGDEQEIHMLVDFGVSNHSLATVWTSLIAFTLLYGVLAVIWFWLLRRHTLKGPPPPGSSEDIAHKEYDPDDDDGVAPLTFGSDDKTATATAQEEK